MKDHNVNKFKESIKEQSFDVTKEKVINNLTVLYDKIETLNGSPTTNHLNEELGYKFIGVRNQIEHFASDLGIHIATNHAVTSSSHLKEGSTDVQGFNELIERLKNVSKCLAERLNQSTTELINDFFVICREFSIVYHKLTKLALYTGLLIPTEKVA